MAELFPIVVFEVDLEVNSSNLPPHSRGEQSYIKFTRSTFIPGMLCGDNAVFKHGDQFSLRGQQARYLYNLINKGLCPHVKVINFGDIFQEEGIGGSLLAGTATVTET
jgi:hypothetical protein